MRQYGFCKATDISKKQIGVIYAKAKCGSLKVEKWFMSELYDLADYYGYDDGASVVRHEQEVLRILDHVFSGDIDGAQTLIDKTTESWFELFSTKVSSKFDHSFV